MVNQPGYSSLNPLIGCYPERNGNTKDPNLEVEEPNVFTDLAAFQDALLTWIVYSSTKTIPKGKKVL
jgi:hypothetical protein